MTRHNANRSLLLLAVAATAALLNLGASASRADDATTSPASASAGDLSDLSLEDLMNVEVTSVSKQKQKVLDAPAAVAVITRDDAQRTGLNSVPELLRLAPGLHVARLDAGNWSIAARGFNGMMAADLLVLMDGRSVYTPVFSGVLWRTIDYPMGDLDRIEVIRGPGSTLWGSNAVNGVINIMTLPADRTQGARLDLRYGTESSSASVRYGGKLDDKTFFRIYGLGRYTDDFRSASGDEANDHWDSQQFGFRVDHYATADETLTVQGDVRMAAGNETVAGPGFAFQDFNRDSGGNLLARYVRRRGQDEELSVQVYLDRDADRNPTVSWTTNTLDLSVQHRLQLDERHQITWGVGGRQHFIDVEAGQVLAPGEDHISPYLLNTFVQDRITLVKDRLNWYVGTKLEYASVIGDFEWQPSTRLVWSVDDRQTVWAGVSKSARLPGAHEAFPTSSGGAELVPASGLGAEHAVTYELGYKVRPAETVTIDVSTFFTSHEGLIDLRPGDSPNQLVYDELLDAKTYGVELAANWQVTPEWRLAGSYTFLAIDAKGSPFALPGQEANLEGSAPRHQAQLHSYWSLTKAVTLTTSAYFYDAIPAMASLVATQPAVPSFVRLDVGLVWKIGEDATLSFGVQNLLDDRHPETSNVDTNTVPSEVGRSAYAQFSMAF